MGKHINTQYLISKHISIINNILINMLLQLAESN